MASISAVELKATPSTAISSAAKGPGESGDGLDRDAMAKTTGPSNVTAYNTIQPADSMLSNDPGTEVTVRCPPRTKAGGRMRGQQIVQGFFDLAR